MSITHNGATRTYLATESGVLTLANMYIKLIRVVGDASQAQGDTVSIKTNETVPFEFWATIGDAARHIDEVLWEDYVDGGCQVVVSGTHWKVWVTYK